MQWKRVASLRLLASITLQVSACIGHHDLQRFWVKMRLASFWAPVSSAGVPVGRCAGKLTNVPVKCCVSIRRRCRRSTRVLWIQWYANISARRPQRQLQQMHRCSAASVARDWRLEHSPAPIARQCCHWIRHPVRR